MGTKEVIMMKMPCMRKIFGNTPRVKVLELFFTYPSCSYYVTDVSKELKISRTTTTNIVVDFTRMGILYRDVRKRYRLNKENDFVKLYMKMLYEIYFRKRSKL